MLLNCGVEKTLDSSLDCKEIKSVNPKGNQSWIFIGKNWCWSWNSNTLATWCKELTPWKRYWCWERLKAGGEGDDRGWDSWMASRLDGLEFEQAPGVGDGQGSLVCYSPWGHKESDTTEWLSLLLHTFLLTQWTWVWASSGSWWCPGKPGVLQSMGSQRVGHDLETELKLCQLLYL